MSKFNCPNYSHMKSSKFTVCDFILSLRMYLNKGSHVKTAAEVILIKLANVNRIQYRVAC